MNHQFLRRGQLEERDVRQDAPDLNPNEFLNGYLRSNFPQTAAHPSQMQLDGKVPINQTPLKLEKPKIPSGINFDRPEVR
jgi:hypothetical protein